MQSAKYRGTWQPAWMSENSWIEGYQLPADSFAALTAEIEDDNENGENVTCGESDSRESNSTSTTSDDYLLPLFGYAARAIIQATPWSPTNLTQSVRREILNVVLKKFLHRCSDCVTFGRQAKELLSAIRLEDVPLEVQAAQISFTMNSAWTFDSFRAQDNFYTKEAFEKFQAWCTDQVQDRLHQINQDVGKAERRVTDAINCWNELHSGDLSCFGGNLAVEMTKLAWEAVDPISGREITAVPVDVDVSLCFGEVVEAVATLHGRADFDSDRKSLLWRCPRPCVFFLGHGSKDASQYQLRFHISEKRLCGFFGGKKIAELKLDLSPALFSQISPFDDPQRQRCGIGGHFSSLRSADIEAGIVGTITCSMTCMNPTHNTNIPPINVAVEQERRRTALTNIRDDMWRFDHHLAVLRLTDVLGEMDDTVQTAIHLYCDRFLIHEELATVATLASVVSNSKFQDEENRELIVAATERLVQLRPQLVAKSNAQVVDDALQNARRIATDNILAIEDVATVPNHAGDILLRCREVLRLTGIVAKEIPDLVTRRTMDDVRTVTHKLLKLTKLIPSSRPALNRVSVLFELEQRDDRTLLVGKAKVLLDLSEQVLFVAKSAVEFALSSRHRGVLAIACRRCDILVTELLEPLRGAVTAVFAELAQSKQPDPLGDALGMIVLLYQAAVELAQVCDRVEELEHLCHPLIALFENYFPCWFSLCEAKVQSWIRNIVRNEPLRPMNPGKVLSNAAPGDARNLLEALYSVFSKVLGWSDPSLAPMYITSFVKLTGLFAETFVDQMMTKGRESTELEQWLACICSLSQFHVTVKQFYRQRLFTETILEYDNEDKMLQAQCQIVFKESVEALLVERIDEFSEFIGQGVSTWCLSVLSHGVIIELEEDLEAELALVLKCTTPSEKKTVLRSVAVGFHAAFATHVLGMCEAPLCGDRRTDLCEILEVIERTLERISELEQVELFDYAHRSRSLLQIASLSSGQLIASAADPLLKDSEKQRALSVLRCRTDRDAVKFVRNAC